MPRAPRHRGAGRSRARHATATATSTPIAGKTTLYGAIESGYKAALAKAEKDPSRIYAVLVMTDGKDTGSNLGLEEIIRRITPAAESTTEVKVFTIAYGNEADPKALARIAEAAKGSSVKGSTADIVQVYRDMAAFF